MRLRPVASAGFVVLTFFTATFAQHSFRTYPDQEVNPAPIPPDANEKTEWAFARLR
jgi:hypothetical protein